MSKPAVSIDFGGLLLTALVVLKLLGKISISWWWVLAPAWIPVALVFGAFGLFLLFTLVLSFMER